MHTHLNNAVPPASIPNYAPDAETLITSAEVRRLAAGISDMSLWRWIRKGIIPAPMMIERRRYWRRAEIIAALNAAAEKNAA